MAIRRFYNVKSCLKVKRQRSIDGSHFRWLKIRTHTIESFRLQDLDVTHNSMIWEAMSWLKNQSWKLRIVESNSIL